MDNILRVCLRIVSIACIALVAISIFADTGVRDIFSDARSRLSGTPIIEYYINSSIFSTQTISIRYTGSNGKQVIKEAIKTPLSIKFSRFNAPKANIIATVSGDVDGRGVSVAIKYMGKTVAEGHNYTPYPLWASAEYTLPTN